MIVLAPRIFHNHPEPGKHLPRSYNIDVIIPDANGTGDKATRPICHGVDVGAQSRI